VLVADKPGWYYVGDGQLRYMDPNGWTDQYKLVDSAAKSDTQPPAVPDVLGTVARASVHGQDAQTPSSFFGLCVTSVHRLMAVLTPLMVALWRFIATRYGDASASLSKKSIARQQLSVMHQPGVPTTQKEPRMFCEKCGATIGGVTQFCPACGAAVTHRPLDDAQPSPGSSGSGPLAEVKRPSRTKYVVAGAVVAASLVGVIGIVLSKDVDGIAAGGGLSLKVSLADNQADATNCPADSYSGQRLSGSRITVLIADGTIAGTALVSGDGAFRPTTDENGDASDGCFWEASIPSVPESAAYTVRIEGPTGRDQTMTYSKIELDEMGWKLDLAKNF